MAITRGLVIKSPWTDLILKGKKTWEIRGSKTNIRGKIGIIESGTGTIVGTANLVDSLGPLSVREMNKHGKEHQLITPMKATEMPYAKTYAWVMEDVVLFKKPKPYKHPMGAVIWVDLENQYVDDSCMKCDWKYWPGGS